MAANGVVAHGVMNCHVGKLMQTAQEQGPGVNHFAIFLYLHLHYISSLKRYANFGVLMPTAEISRHSRHHAGAGKTNVFVHRGRAGFPASIAARLGCRGWDIQALGAGPSGTERAETAAGSLLSSSHVQIRQGWVMQLVWTFGSRQPVSSPEAMPNS